MLKSQTPYEVSNPCFPQTNLSGGVTNYFIKNFADVFKMKERFYFNIFSKHEKNVADL